MSQQDRLPTGEEWEQWLDHPATKALQSVLRSWKEGVKDQWAAGAFTDMSQFGTAILNAKAIGAVQIIDQIIGIEYDRVAGELSDGE